MLHANCIYEWIKWSKVEKSNRITLCDCGCKKEVHHPYPPYKIRVRTKRGGKMIGYYYFASLECIHTWSG